MEADYQLALVLDYKYNQEAKKKSVDPDYELALKLQNEFQAEAAIDNPSNNLVYESKKKQKQNLNSSKCLVDPSWEVIDPTPDIHILFMAFNKRFFWNKLLAVAVSWSKRMTTCAGICSYQGRGGLCHITLSEPLLKLRPRKDLVETLLHEMIHAFLFVTHNNKDRDGHGPEFHKHMYRINSEAGTNITVYHDFHDEVRLYQQHWWRCDGPCQHWKPYFGMVRRAMNRAPGPTDRWWGEHSRTCGGNFIKVKEPEKAPKKTKSQTKKENKKPKADIRNFFPNFSPKEKPILKSNNIKTISSNNNKASVTNVIPKSSNIFGFTGLGTNSKPVPKGSLSGKTIVINPTTKPVTKNQNQRSVSVSEVEPFNCPGKSLGSKNVTKTDDYNAVRNHWANKFASNSNQQPISKKPKLDKQLSLPNDPFNDDFEKSTSNCPICNKTFPIVELSDHLDICLNNDLKDLTNSEEVFVPSTSKTNLDQIRECTVCEKSVSSLDFDKHVEKCLQKFYKELDDKYDLNKTLDTDCLSCGKKIKKTDLDSHLDECMQDIFTTEVEEKPEKTDEYNCPFCMKLVLEAEMSDHIDICLNLKD